MIKQSGRNNIKQDYVITNALSSERLNHTLVQYSKRIVLVKSKGKGGQLSPPTREVIYGATQVELLTYVRFNVD